MCHKYVPGMRMFDFTYDTPWLTGRRFYEQAGGRKCILMFLRYIGCSTCNLEMLTLRRDYMRFQAKKVKLFVVLQSEPATLREYGDENFFPFEIICDPAQTLYHRCAVGSNPHPEKRSERLEQKLSEARSLGIQHGRYEGNEAQLPATFILDEHQNILYAKYGIDSVDIPEHADLLRLV